MSSYLSASLHEFNSFVQVNLVSQLLFASTLGMVQTFCDRMAFLKSTKGITEFRSLWERNIFALHQLSNTCSHIIFICWYYFSYPSHWVCKLAYLVPVQSQDKLGELRQEGHPA